MAAERANYAACESYRRMLTSSMSRRKILQSSLALGAGVGLTRLAESLAIAADREKNKPAKSLLFIWLQGGPSQLETFDPHPGTLIGGDTKSLASSVRGVDIADSMPATASLLHKTTLVRSVVSKEGDHERASFHLKTGWRPEPTLVHPSIGSVVCYESKDNLEIPRHISIQPSQWPARAGYLGPALDAFQIGDPAQPIPNLTAPVPEDRMEARVDKFLPVVEDEFRRGRLMNLDGIRTQHVTATKKAVKMMSSEQLTAFDISQESDSLQSQFGDSGFGRGCLAAVRLLQAGVRCVEVELSGWDSHINNHEIQTGNAAVLDQALATTLRELEARDLLESTVVFCGGEFGRTPQINPTGGRDHWPHGFCSLLAGGRFRKGYVHGATDGNPDPELLQRNGQSAFDPTKVTQDCLSVPELHATMLYALGINPADEHMTPIGRPMRWSDAEPVKQLLQA